MKNSKLIFWALVDSLGIFVYVFIVALIGYNAQNIFGKEDNFADPIMFLLLFVVSATITGSLFLGRPIWLYFEGFKKESIKLFLYTLVCLIFVTLLIFAYKVSI